MVGPWTQTWSSLQLGLDVTTAPGGSAHHSDGHLRLWGRASDINRDPGCSKVTDPDMALSCSSGLDVTMALHSYTGHSDLHASWTQVADLPLGIHTALSGNRSHACSPRPWRLQGHRPRHGPQQEPRPGCHHKFRWPRWQSGLWTPT